MISIDDLKAMQILTDLPDEKLGKLAAIAKEMLFLKDVVIFNECDIGSSLFFLKRGKVLLERSLRDKVTLAMGAVNPGTVFGWYSLKSKGLYSWNAICDEDSAVFVFNVDELRKLCDEDNELGYLLLLNLLANVKSRLDFRSEQLLRVIRSHPHVKFSQ